MLVILASQWSCAGQPLYYLLGCEGAFLAARRRFVPAVTQLLEALKKLVPLCH